MAEQNHNKVAFIVVGWNNKDILGECLDSIFMQEDASYLVIYVDNASHDGSVEFVRHNYPGVIVVEPGINTGFARGNNIGIAQALESSEVDYIALLNTDARLDKNWTATLVAFAQKKPRGALYQGTTLDYYNNNIIDSTHVYVSHNGQGTQGNWRSYFTFDFGPKKVFGVNAAACLISRNFIEAQPFKTLFDETLFMYLEDVDLAMRATIMGWDNYTVHGAMAFHMGSASSGKNPGYSLYMTFRNNSCVLFKNMPIHLIARMLPNLIRGDIDTIRELRRRGKKSASHKVVKGRLAGILRTPLFIIKRRKMQRANHIDRDYLWQLMRRGY